MASLFDKSLCFYPQGSPEKALQEFYNTWIEDNMGAPAPTFLDMFIALSFKYEEVKRKMPC